jgi:hypothetical protein
MNNKRLCFKYEPPIKRLTKSNCITADSRVIYIVKKDYKGNASKLYIAYDYVTKIQIAFHKDKEFLIKFLQNKSLGVLNENN